MENCEVFEVESSTIKKVGYNHDTRDMVIEFMSGEQYLYEDVPRDEFMALVEAESVGTHFADEIRDEYEGLKLVVEKYNKVSEHFV